MVRWYPQSCERWRSISIEADEVTGRSILPKDRLAHGRYYKGRCRHATVARWHEPEQQFYHWREKMGLIYIDVIRHPDDEPFFDVFRVVEELPTVKFQIPFDGDPVFDGNPEELVEFKEEMWKRPRIDESYDCPLPNLDRAESLRPIQVSLMLALDFPTL